MEQEKEEKALVKREIGVVEDFKDYDIAELIPRDNLWSQICTRGADPNKKELVEFKTFTPAKLQKIAENMPEINRACNVFGRKNTQTTNKLMTLNMISHAPYKRLKQCVAQIERKRGALKENIFRLRKEKVKLDRLVGKKTGLILKIEEAETLEQKTHLSYQLRLLEISIEEKATGIADSTIYIEGALKEIGVFQRAYNEIVKSYGLPENWDEKDFEEAEIEDHLKTAFLHGIRDVEMTGRLNVGTMEYLEQYGVNPTTAIVFIRKYLADHNDMMQSGLDKGEIPSIGFLYDFLDKMYEMFKDEHEKVMKRIGIETMIDHDMLFKDQV